MADKLDMSLDDIIKQGKKPRGRGGRRGGGGGSNRGGGGRGRGGAMRTNTGLRSNKSTPYSRPKQLPDRWQHDLFDGSSSGGGSKAGGFYNSGGVSSGGLSTGTKLHISNLDFAVSESDIEELFREFGKVKRSCVHYDATARSHGTAEVVYFKREDAMNAIKQYNGVPLDGRAMKIEMMAEPTSQSRPRENNITSQRRSGQGRGRGFGGRGRGGRRGTGFRRGRGGGAGGGGSGRKNPTKTAEELDAELDAYHGTTDPDDVDMLEA